MAYRRRAGRQLPQAGPQCRLQPLERVQAARLPQPRRTFLLERRKRAHGLGRIQAGIELARHLETLSEISPGERIDIVAHSHDCNVVKQATQELQHQVPVGRIIFLACPHFVDVQDQSLPYRLNPHLFENHGGRTVLNFYSQEDTVQISIAGTMPELALPLGLPMVD